MLRDSRTGVVTMSALKDFCSLICASLLDRRYEGRWKVQPGGYLGQLYPVAGADLLNF
jgi:hypothetical protein